MERFPKESFESLHNLNLVSPSPTSEAMAMGGPRFSKENVNYVIWVDESLRATAKINNRKTCGPDGIMSEAIKYGSRRLITHLSLVFKIFKTHSYIPADMICTTIIIVPFYFERIVQTDPICTDENNFSNV